MTSKSIGMVTAMASAMTLLASCAPPPSSDHDSPAAAGGLAVPGGLAFSEFNGYEKWQVIWISHGMLLAVIVGNETMIQAFKSGSPGNGKPFPDGAKMAKMHWSPKRTPRRPDSPPCPTRSTTST